MLSLTEAAKQKLHSSLAAADKPQRQGKCFRMVPKNDRTLTIELARPTPSDTVFRHEGEDILALPKALQRYVQDKSLDIDREGNLKLN